MSELKKCPFCGGEAYISQMWGEDSEKYWYRVGCTVCGMGLLPHSKTIKEQAIAAWNRRAPSCDIQQYAESCADCGFCNEPLTLDEMNALDHEPIYVLHTGGKWTMNGWHIATASSYQNHGRCDLEIDNGNTIIDMQNYGNTWLAYRAKPERSEG